jgi:hypothetical protein
VLTRHVPQHVENIYRLGHEHSQVIPYGCVRSRCFRISRSARHDSNLSALILSHPCGYQCPGIFGRLDNDDDMREPGNNAIPSGEMVRACTLPRIKLGHKDPVVYNVFGQPSVAARVNAVDACSHHGNGTSSGVECSLVRGSIDAYGQSTYNRDSG